MPTVAVQVLCLWPGSMCENAFKPQILNLCVNTLYRRKPLTGTSFVTKKWGSPNSDQIEYKLHFVTPVAP